MYSHDTRLAWKCRDIAQDVTFSGITLREETREVIDGARRVLQTVVDYLDQKPAPGRQALSEIAERDRAAVKAMAVIDGRINAHGETCYRANERLTVLLADEIFEEMAGEDGVIDRSEFHARLTRRAA